MKTMYLFTIPIAFVVAVSACTGRVEVGSGDPTGDTPTPTGSAGEPTPEGIPVPDDATAPPGQPLDASAPTPPPGQPTDAGAPTGWPPPGQPTDASAPPGWPPPGQPVDASAPPGWPPPGQPVDASAPPWPLDAQAPPYR